MLYGFLDMPNKKMTECDTGIEYDAEFSFPDNNNLKLTYGGKNLEFQRTYDDGTKKAVANKENLLIIVEFIVNSPTIWIEKKNPKPADSK